MSRRHQGGRPHRANGHARHQATPLAAPPSDVSRVRPDPVGLPRPDGPPPPAEPPAQAAPPAVGVGSEAAPIPQPPVPGGTAYRTTGGDGPAPPRLGADAAQPGSAGCTAPQLRRFIKSRPYVPMHELRRRFGINGVEDEVSAVDLHDRRIFVGLPEREGALLAELLRAGDVGYELSLDPRTPVVVGLYPMRPVPRS